MKFIYKIFRKNPDGREDIMVMTSGLGIFVNLILATVKVLIGLLASSIAIVSEGVNNAADCLSAVLALVGTKLAGRHPDEKHPFGYGRIEYLVSLIISVSILVTGIEMLISSVKLVFHPRELKISLLAIVIVAVSAAVKFLLGTYTIKMGKKADSNVLVGVGVDGRNDCFASVITLASSLLFLVFHISVDAYAGILVSFLILKAGLDILVDTVSDLIGKPGEHDLAMKIYREIRKTDGVIYAIDMMLHNYGPDAWSGSVNVEIDHKKTVGEVYNILHELQLRIMHDYKVTMVFGIYAVDNDNAESKELRKKISSFIKTKEHVKSYHAVYLSEEERKLYCDFIVDYRLQDWETLEKEFVAYITEYYPEYEIELTIETEFV